MKKIRILLVLSVVLLGIAGCRNSEKDSSIGNVKVTSTPAETEEITPIITAEPTQTEVSDVNVMDYYQSILQNTYSQYGADSLYALYDLDEDGIEELFVSTGTGEEDWKNEVYTVNTQNAEMIGSFGTIVLLYEVDDGQGVYGVHDNEEEETIYQITKSGNQLDIATLFQGEISEEGEYYSSDNLILWNRVMDIVEITGDNSTDIQNMEYILPNSDSTYLTNEEISGLTADEIQMAINEIYARHGRKFQNKDIQEYFDGKSWYTGTVEPEDFDESVLSDVEQSNIQTLVTAQKPDDGKQLFRDYQGYYSNPETYQIVSIAVYENSETYGGQLLVAKEAGKSPDTAGSEVYNLMYASDTTATIVDEKKGQVLERGTVEFYDGGIYITWDTGYLTGHYQIGMP